LEVVAVAGPKYSTQQKATFFDLIDKGGTVRAAAKAVGVHEDAAYTWLRQAGLSMQRATPRKYSEADKAEFFRLLALRPNVSAVARELGFTRVTCYVWAEEFLRLRAAGLTRAEARARVGADNRSATDWDKGITIINRGRIYPDGRVVRYPPSTLSSVKRARTGRTIGGRVDLNQVEKIIDARYLSLLEREQLQDFLRAGLSLRKIASELGRSPSTISRELRRNTVSTRGYLPHTAHRLSVQRRGRPRQPKVLANAELREFVQIRLGRKWSPQQISNRLAKDFAATPEMRVSTETIYQAIYVHARGELKREFAKQLRRGHVTRKTRKHPDARRPRFVDAMLPIAQRPPEIETRQVPGHWEGDLIIGAAAGSAIATLVERTSRYVMLAHLGRERSADAVRDSLINTVQRLPEGLRGTLTWDQGAEMSEHRAFTVATDMKVYFCEAGSPWQRGTNENTNGLLRQYFPRGTDLAHHTAEQFLAVADELNGRPRKALDWDTPAERIAALLNAS
jgi:IS30 family transposase